VNGKALFSANTAGVHFQAGAAEQAGGDPVMSPSRSYPRRRASRMAALGFREAYFKNYGQFSNLKAFENHGFIFLRDPSGTV
jgi:hypothetical protein